MDDRDMTAFLLGNVARQLALMTAAEIEGHVERCAQSANRFDAIGCLLDPTGYLRARDDGTYDDARHQLEIAKHLLAARRAIDKREELLQVKATGPRN